MSIRNFALILFATMTLAAGAVLAPQARGIECHSAYFGAGYVCNQLTYSGIIARSMAQRVGRAALTEPSALMDTLTSSPFVNVDFSPARRLTMWWMEQTGGAVMARFTLH